MVLVLLGQSTCAICGEVLVEHQPIVGFPAFIADQRDPLFPYSDSAMHESCFEAWEHRDAMIRKYRVARGEIREDPADPRVNIAILGTPEQRSQLLDQLRRHVQPSVATD